MSIESLNFIQQEIKAHISVTNRVLHELAPLVEVVAYEAVKCLKHGGKILLFGNGGSAADAQHIAAELTGRYKKERLGLPAIALTTDTSALTAIGNDYGYERVFSRQVQALAREGDMLVGISTSGNSQNVLLGLEEGRKIGCVCVGFSGRDGGKMHEACEYNLVVPSDDTPRIQEMHIMLAHIICHIIEENLAKE